MLVNFLIVIIVVMVSLLIGAVAYMNYAKKQLGDKKGSYVSKDFDSIVVDNP